MDGSPRSQGARLPASSRRAPAGAAACLQWTNRRPAGRQTGPTAGKAGCCPAVARPARRPHTADRSGHRTRWAARTARTRCRSSRLRSGDTPRPRRPRRASGHRPRRTARSRPRDDHAGVVELLEEPLDVLRVARHRARTHDLAEVDAGLRPRRNDLRPEMIGDLLGRFPVGQRADGHVALMSSRPVVITTLRPSASSARRSTSTATYGPAICPMWSPPFGVGGVAVSQIRPLTLTPLGQARAAASSTRSRPVSPHGGWSPRARGFGGGRRSRRAAPWWSRRRCARHPGRR